MTSSPLEEILYTIGKQEAIVYYEVAKALTKENIELKKYLKKEIQDVIKAVFFDMSFSKKSLPDQIRRVILLLKASGMNKKNLIIASLLERNIGIFSEIEDLEKLKHYITGLADSLTLRNLENEDLRLLKEVLMLIPSNLDNLIEVLDKENAEYLLAFFSEFPGDIKHNKKIELIKQITKAIKEKDSGWGELAYHWKKILKQTNNKQLFKFILKTIDHLTTDETSMFLENIYIILRRSKNFTKIIPRLMKEKPRKAAHLTYLIRKRITELNNEKPEITQNINLIN